MKKLFIVLTAGILIHGFVQAQFSFECMNTKNHLHKRSGSEAKLSSGLVSDTIHVVHYSIHIDTLNFATQNIKAKTEVTVTPVINGVNNISLSLLQLLIDSIVYPGGNLSYTYNDTVIRITPPATMNTGDTLMFTVHYRGQPKQDASGWGGFYFSTGFAFNLGVGFAADPHNFGRVWYPCIDEFTDRSTYDFYITTSSAHKAFCNGELISETTNPNGTKTWHWNLNQTIPSYLASMAAGNFYTMNRNYQGIPIVFATLAGDTAGNLVSFQKLDTTLGIFIDRWGPYPWNKVGFTMIPFTSGAMEHATSIHIGRIFVNGTLSYQTLWAHELSHMWWGDKVTCSTQEDMWLNEGWASYNEALFTESISGIAAYKNWIRTNHRKILQFAHTPAQDGNYYAMNNIPHSITYGYHVYQKGADIVHTIRNMMGDSAFYAGCKYYMNNRAYSDASSADLRDDLTAGGGVNMNDFFAGWIFTPGNPHFSIDSVQYIPGGLDHYWVYTRQRAKGNPGFIYKMPVEITFSDGVNDTTVTVVIDSATNVFHIPLIGVFNWIAIDRNEKVSDAISDIEKTITATGNVTMDETNVVLNIQNAASGTTQIRVEHNWVAPDGFKQSNPGIRLSDYHYWKVDGVFDPGFHTKGIFTYDGSTSPNTGYLDNTLITGVDDSLVILHRASTADDWKIVNGFVNNTGASHIDKKGSITVDTLQKGEYTLGYYDYTVGISTQAIKENFDLKVSPNPSQGVFEISFNIRNVKDACIRINDMQGKEIYFTPVFSYQESIKWDASEVAAGKYVLCLVAGERKAETSVVVAR